MKNNYVFHYSFRNLPKTGQKYELIFGSGIQVCEISQSDNPLKGLGRGGVEWNRTNFELIFIEFFSPFESIDLQIFESNQTNFEQIPISEKLVSSYSWSRIESNNFRINFHQILRIFFPPFE